jgi:hypothetical protein
MPAAIKTIFTRGLSILLEYSVSRIECGRLFWFAAIKQAIIAKRVVRTGGSKIAKSIRLCKATPMTAANRAAATFVTGEW